MAFSSEELTEQVEDASPTMVAIRSDRLVLQDMVTLTKNYNDSACEGSGNNCWTSC